MQSWRAMRDKVPQDSRLEVDQQEMIRDSAAAAERLAAFLDLSDEHRRKLEALLARNRPQQTSAGTAERVLSLSEIWDEPSRSLFRAICGPEMEAFGYSFDENYWSAAASPAAATQG